MIIDRFAVTRLLPVPDCIVEERVFLRGNEVVSHVNFTQLDRVRNVRPHLPRRVTEDAFPVAKSA